MIYNKIFLLLAENVCYGNRSSFSGEVKNSGRASCFPRASAQHKRLTMLSKLAVAAVRDRRRWPAPTETRMGLFKKKKARYAMIFRLIQTTRALFFFVVLFFLRCRAKRRNGLIKGALMYVAEMDVSRQNKNPCRKVKTVVYDTPNSCRPLNQARLLERCRPFTLNQRLLFRPFVKTFIFFFSECLNFRRRAEHS